MSQYGGIELGYLLLWTFKEISPPPPFILFFFFFSISPCQFYLDLGSLWRFSKKKFRVFQYLFSLGSSTCNSYTFYFYSHRNSTSLIAHVRVVLT